VVFVSVFLLFVSVFYPNNYVYYMQWPKWFKFSLYRSEFCQQIQDLKKSFRRAKFKLIWHMNVLFRFTVIPYNQKRILPHRYFSRLVTLHLNCLFRVQKNNSFCKISNFYLSSKIDMK
jgi:hypothetical protein